MFRVRALACFDTVHSHLLPDAGHFIEAPYATNEVGLFDFPFFTPAFHFGFSSEPLNAITCKLVSSCLTV
jgi:hypothetical protein